MKFSTATLTLLSLTSSSLAYDTANDVTNAFNSAKDVASITSKVGTDAAYTEYTSGAGNFDSTIQNLAQGAEGPFLAGFTALFGESHLDTFTSNGLQCNGSFAGQSQDICDMMAKKMLLCTTLGYSWTQGYKAIAAAESEKNKSKNSNAKRAAPPRATIALDSFFVNKNDDDDIGSNAPLADSSTNDIDGNAYFSSPPKDIPVLYDWTQSEDGGISGRVKGSRKFGPGARVTTTPVQANAQAGTVVTTESGSRYERKSNGRNAQIYCHFPLISAFL